MLSYESEQRKYAEGKESGDGEMIEESIKHQAVILLRPLSNATSLQNELLSHPPP